MSRTPSWWGQGQSHARCRPEPSRRDGAASSPWVSPLRSLSTSASGFTTMEALPRAPERKMASRDH